MTHDDWVTIEQIFAAFIFTVSMMILSAIYIAKKMEQWYRK